MTTPANYSLHHRKETILMIAEEVFAQYSFSGETIRLITERSGVNSAMISYYFGSKEALYLDIFNLRLNETAQEIDQFEQLNLDPAEKLKTYLTAFIQRIASNQNFHRLLCNELVTVQHRPITVKVSEVRNRLYNFLLKTIKKGTAEGCFKKVDEEVFALSIISLVRSAFTDQLTTRDHLNKSQQQHFAGRIVSHFMSMLTLEDHNQFERRNHV